jgi:hypothetical protein
MLQPILGICFELTGWSWNYSVIAFRISFHRIEFPDWSRPIVHIETEVLAESKRKKSGVQAALYNCNLLSLVKRWGKNITFVFWVISSGPSWG